MSQEHPAVVALLERVLASLAAHDDEAAAQLSTELEALIRATPEPLADPRVKPLIERCNAAAAVELEERSRELRASATSTRAAQAYGGR